MYKKVAAALGHLARTGTPLRVYVALARTAMTRSSMSIAHDVPHGTRTTGDWTTRVVPYWLDAFQRTRVAPAQILEIGAWEGLTSCFLLKRFENASITCVDTWEGGDGINADATIEHNFDLNVAAYAQRVRKVKERSINFFTKLTPEDTFDLIYIDGSHFADDVLIDALLGFAHLSQGGLMIFDDYLWSNYPIPRENPAAAVNAFLNLKVGELRLISAYYQVIVQKL